MKKSDLFLLICMFAVVIFILGVYAQEETQDATALGDESYLDDVTTETESTDVSTENEDISFFDETAELSETEGITPDSALYLCDEFLDKFGDGVSLREEKIAEIRAMIRAGKVEEAKIALQNYLEHADDFEQEVSPEESEEARRSASAIYNTFKELESEIPEEDRKEFNLIVEKEQSIVTASRIAGKIKELCEQLSKLDPNEYSRVCKTGDDAPEWQKRLDRDLTDEQRAEAKKFGGIMQQCFETAGQQCACEEIPFADFAEVCSIAAPLATACEIEGDEEACNQLDNLEMPELPEHLQDVFDDLERDISESQFELHIPKECKDAGATSPRECMRIMIQTHAPEECRVALVEANVQNEREAREICEKIMFERNAPEECMDAGLTDHRECGKLMFRLNAPEECIDAGMAGEHRNDHKKCEEIMNNFRGDRSGPNGGHGFGGNCAGIQNSEERLKCYDGATQGVRNFDERFRETQDAQRQCAENCLSKGEAWDFSNGVCSCRQPERFDDSQFKDFSGEEFSSPEEFQQSEQFVPPQCGEGESLVCNDSGCTCVSQGTETSDTQTTTESTTATESTTESATSEPSDESATTTESANTESSGTTGAVISGNAFIDYYFR